MGDEGSVTDVVESGDAKEPKFLIAGYGAIGQLVHQVLMDRNANVVAIAEPDKEKVPADLRDKKLWIPHVGRLEDDASEVTRPDNHGIVYTADTAICFTDTKAGYETTKSLLEGGIDTVVGTTTWYLNPDKSVNMDMIAELGDLAKENNCRFVYASNFSAAVMFMRRLAVFAARLLTPHGYDIAVEERHHTRKKDVSGTGGAICNDLIEADIGKTAIKLEGHDKPREPHEITLSVTRAGNTPGTHTVVYDGTYDTLEIKHTVRSRGVFAEGAVNAAFRVKEKPPGMYVLENLLE